MKIIGPGWPHRLALISALLIMGGCATKAQRQLAAEQRAQQIPQLLIHAGDPDSLAAAAMLYRDPLWRRSESAALTLLDRAVQAAPQRADLTWLQLRVCAELDACDAKPVEARLRLLDPTNGAGWMQSLAVARLASDAAAAQAALVAIGQSGQIRFYWTTLVSHLARAMTGSGMYESKEALSRAIAELANTQLQLQPLVQACSREAVEVPAVMQNCRAVAGAFLHSDTVLTELFGISLARYLWPPEATENQQAVELLRQVQYQSSMLAGVERRPSWSTKDGQREVLKLCSTLASEQEVMRAEIKAAGLDPQPPPGWTSPAAPATSSP
ncbi:MAG TPA: hypothetical protein VF848_09305 [Steroidobacteraceae bacterium]